MGGRGFAGRIAALARRRMVTLVVALVVIAGGVTAGLVLSGSSAPRYVTARAETGTVQQTTTLSGTIEPVTEAQMSFATSGTVASVPVSVGEKVKSGAVLATLQTDQLSAQVDQARGSLDNAEASLQKDESPSGSSVNADEAALTTAQNTLNNDRTTLNDDTTMSATSLAEVEQSAQSAQAAVSGDDLALTNDESALTAARDKAAADCSGDNAAGSPSCVSDQNAVAADETAVTGDQRTVTSDETAAAAAEDALTSTELKNEQTITQDRQHVASDETQLRDARSNLESANDGTYADQLDSDRAAVTSAQAALATAEANLADASLLSPISGTVIAVNVIPGDAASAGSSSVGSPSSAGTSSGGGAAIEVVSPGTFEIQATASARQVAEIKLGNAVLISPTGATTLATGTVTAVGTVATVSNGVATFPITIGVKGSPPGLYEGATASLTLVVLQVKNVLTVPTSAVHTFGPMSFVYLLKNGKEVRHSIVVGASGGVLTQVKRGLKPGEAVVIANLSASVPGSSPNTNVNIGPGIGKVFIGPGGSGARSVTQFGPGG